MVDFQNQMQDLFPTIRCILPQYFMVVYNFTKATMLLRNERLPRCFNFTLLNHALLFHYVSIIVQEINTLKIE